MDNAILAIYYDLSEESRNKYLGWFHEKYLPELLSRSGYLWAAHYEAASAGRRFQKVLDALGRTSDPGQSSGTGFVALFGGESTRTFFNPSLKQLKEREGDEAKEMIGLRVLPRAWIYTVEWSMDGPESRTRDSRGIPAPAIQMGRFNAPREDEEDLGAWYAQERMPMVSRAPGCVGGRKLLAAAGDPKHAVLYEFISLEARENHFVPLEETAWSDRIHHYVVHPPGSPFVGRRIWPPAS
jgi:hypothetical protein